MLWSAVYAGHLNTVHRSIANIGLRPPLLDNAHSAAVIKHVVEVVMAAVQHLNPGQTPVLAIEVQCTFPDRYGEANFVPMLEELEIEMAVMKMHGDWLNGSSWTTIVRSGMASSGVADSFLKNQNKT